MSVLKRVFKTIYRQNFGQGGNPMSRRGENIYKRKDGRWEGRYKKGNKNGKTIYGYVYASSYQLVKSKLSNIRSISLVDEPNDAKKILLGNVCNKWLEHKKNNTKESTYLRYRTIVDNHILSYFRRMNVYDITTEVLQAFVSQLLSDRFSDKTVLDIVSVMKSILRFSEKLGICHNCILSAVTVRVYPKETRVLTADEFRELTAYFLCEGGPMSCGVLIAMFTGLRLGELCALKYEDIDIVGRKLSVTKTMQRLKIVDISGTHIHIGAPKSRSSVRNIPLTDFLSGIISKQNYSEGDYILTANDKYMEPRTLQYRIKNIMKKLDINGASFHTLRHSFATRCVEVGFDIKSLSEILGHSNVNITLDRYVHSSFDLKVRNMRKMDAFIPCSPSK